MIYKVVDYTLFEREFQRYGKLSDYGSLALKVLFEYLEDMSDLDEHGVQLDVLDICANWKCTHKDFLESETGIYDGSLTDHTVVLPVPGTNLVLWQTF